jgi:hypothetical protein
MQTSGSILYFARRSPSSSLAFLFLSFSIGPTKNKSSKGGMSSAPHLHGIFHHEFTTIYPSFTTQKTTFCAPVFPKTP